MLIEKNKSFEIFEYNKNKKYLESLKIYSKIKKHDIIR